MKTPVLINTLLLAWMTTSASAGDNDGAVLDIADRSQVFIDKRFLQEKQNVRIVVCPPVKTNEKCLIGEGMNVLRGYGNIMAVDGTFRGFDALSKDGSQWRRVKKGTKPEPDDIAGVVS